MANLASSVGSLTEDHVKKLGLVTYPELYFEAWLSPVPGELKGRIQVQPQVLHFAKTAAKRSDSDEKFIGMMLAFIDAAPDPGAKKETVEKKALATIPFEFTKVRVGSEYRAVKGDAGSVRNPLAAQTKVITIRRGDKAASGAINLYAFVTDANGATGADRATGIHRDTTTAVYRFSASQPRATPFIVGSGSSATVDFPAVGAIVSANPSGRSVVGCTGTLISERLVVTAGHCLSLEPRTVFFQHAGLFEIARSLPHPENHVPHTRGGNMRTWQCCV
jgi:hypothetical protein